MRVGRGKGEGEGNISKLRWSRGKKGGKGERDSKEIILKLGWIPGQNEILSSLRLCSSSIPYMRVAISYNYKETRVGWGTRGLSEISGPWEDGYWIYVGHHHIETGMDPGPK